MSVRNVVITQEQHPKELRVRYYSTDRATVLAGYGETVEEALISAKPTVQEADALKNYVIRQELATNILREVWRAPAHDCPECLGSGLNKGVTEQYLCSCLRRLEAK